MKLAAFLLSAAPTLPRKARNVLIVLIAVLGAISAIGSVDAASLPLLDGSLYYRIGGHGFAVLLLSGGPGRSGDYLDPVFDHLTISHRVILPDQRGTGRSRLRALGTDSVTVRKTVADLETLRVTLGVENWTIIGHSWGGMLAMAYTTQHPANVAGLILVGSGGTSLEFFDRSDIVLRQRQTPTELDSIQAWEKQTCDPALRERAMLEVKKLRTGAYLFDRRSLAAVNGTLTPQTYSSQTSELILRDLRRTRYDLRADLRVAEIGASGKRPALILHGDTDAIGKATEHELSAAFPASIHSRKPSLRSLSLDRGTARILQRTGHVPGRCFAVDAVTIAFAETGQGAVIMMNAKADIEVVKNIFVEAIGQQYHWPDP